MDELPSLRNVEEPLHVIKHEGPRFGRLVAIRPDPSRPGLRYWEMQCDCGGTTISSLQNLRSGRAKSCGCLRRAMHIARCTTHAKKPERLYRIWHGMMNRCERPGNEVYSRYGAKGIRVCEEWREYIPFRDWALANGYRDDLTIDRWPDKRGNYEPSNCRWATPAEQSRNKTNNRLLTFQGQTRCLTEWASIMSMSRYALQDRLGAGWSIERALSTPTREYQRKPDS